MNIDNDNPPDGTPLITSMIQPVTIKGQLMYQVNFPGIPKRATVSPPTRAEIALYASAGKNGLWLSVLEKAYCATKNDPFFTILPGVPQDKLQHGERLRNAIEALTGNQTISYTAVNLGLFPNLKEFFSDLGITTTLKQKQTEASIQAVLIAAFKDHDVMTLSVPAKINTGTKANPTILDGPHAYTITNIDLTNPNNPMFTIHNPWNDPSKGIYGADFKVDMDFVYKYFQLFTIQDKNS